MLTLILVADMTVLNTLKLVAYKPHNSNNAVVNRRRKLAQKIDEQVLLASDATWCDFALYQ